MLISGGALEECVLPHTIAKTPEKGTKYSMISEIDFKGFEHEFLTLFQGVFQRL
jgi:hypothetical protein